jgi:hypothetical protein
MIGLRRNWGWVLFSGLVLVSVWVSGLSGADESLEAGKGTPETSLEEARAKAKEAAKEIVRQEEEEGAEKSGGIGAQIGSIIPKGAPAKNVTIPSFEGGVLSSLTEAAVVTFVGDSKDDLEMEDMTIQLFDGDGAVDLVIELETAEYNIPTGLLESDTKAHVKNEQIDLFGDKLIYDTTTRKGKLLRPTMFIFGPEKSKTGEPAEQADTPETPDE